MPFLKFTAKLIPVTLFTPAVHMGALEGFMKEVGFQLDFGETRV